MSWFLLVGLVLALGLALLARFVRRADLARMEAALVERSRLAEQGADKAKLQHPVIDLSRCLGCATCVAACPEQDVLDLVHGQAMVVNGARCAGVAACERECPVGAITVTLADVAERDDIPALTEGLEAVGSPGLFLAGEVTAHALIKTAVDHGTAVGAEVARRLQGVRVQDSVALDLVIVGAGPAGLACALEARRLGLSFVLLDQEDRPGGTVAKYPRRKLVLTRPVDLPLYGRLNRSSYLKEELVELWQGIVEEHALPFRGGEVLEGIERDGHDGYVVRTLANSYAARFVCLAVGRRGTPLKLGVPGEELSKVAYSLMDAQSYTDRRILVVGGGDSAVEAAMGLAEQPGNHVTLSYRKEDFFRIGSRNGERLRAQVDEGRIDLLTLSEVSAFHEDEVELTVQDGAEPQTVSLPNDDVFVMAGGIPPFELLARAGVSFDPSLRPAAAPVTEQGTGLTRALAIGFLLAVTVLAWALSQGEYYRLPLEARPAHPDHVWLRPGRNFGLGMGIAAAALVIVNLAYILRRSPRVRLGFGSLSAWMTSHVATGILALLCALLHSAMAPKDTVGGHAFWALAVLMVTGAVGRYFYACIPRAANGRELELEEVRSELARVSDGWEGDAGGFAEQVRREVDALVAAKQWRTSFFGRLASLLGVKRDLHRLMHRLALQGREQGIDPEQIRETLVLAHRAHDTAVMVAHYEDLRAVLSSWRYLHRWVAALMVVLLVVHVVYALAYGAFFIDGGGR